MKTNSQTNFDFVYLNNHQRRINSSHNISSMLPSNQSQANFFDRAENKSRRVTMVRELMNDDRNQMKKQIPQSSENLFNQQKCKNCNQYSDSVFEYNKQYQHGYSNLKNCNHSNSNFGRNNYQDERYRAQSSCQLKNFPKNDNIYSIDINGEIPIINDLPITSVQSQIIQKSNSEQHSKNCNHESSNPPHDNEKSYSDLLSRVTPNILKNPTKDINILSFLSK